MRVKFLVSMLVLCFLSGRAVSQSIAIGMAGVYGDDIKEPGLNLRADYTFKMEKFGIGPEFTIFRKRTEVINNEQTEVFLYEFNINGHYIIEVLEKIGIYPFVGLNFSREREEKYLGTDMEKSVEEAFGVNLGMGAEYRIRERFKLFVEFDHVFSELRENTLSIGLFYELSKVSKELD